MATLPHLLVRFSGFCYGGPQTWSMGFRFRSATGGDPGGIADIQTKLETWRDAIKALNAAAVFPASWTHVLGAGNDVRSIRCAAIGANGKETAVAIVEGAPLANYNNAAAMPSQVAVCISLDGINPGASNRGRVYLPDSGMVAGADGRIDTNTAHQMASDGGGFLRDLANAGATAVTPGLMPVVISNVKGTASEIVNVRVGNRFDIQRRRADKEAEAYSVAVVPQ